MHEPLHGGVQGDVGSLGEQRADDDDQVTKVLNRWRKMAPAMGPNPAFRRDRVGFILNLLSISKLFHFFVAFYTGTLGLPLPMNLKSSLWQSSLMASCGR